MTGIDSISPVKDIDFAAEASMNAGSLEIGLSGTADLNVKAELDRFLAEVHQHAGTFGMRQVVVDVRRLEFMNSSCLKSFVWWISSVQAAERPYQITFLSSASMYWQRRSLNALACLASDFVSVQS